MSEPKRIQRKRTKGWRMPEGAIYVGRPGKWGNPYTLDRISMHEYVVLYRGDEIAESWGGLGHAAQFSVAAFRSAMTSPEVRHLAQDELAGHDLACWCPLGQPCHADVLLELANGEPA
jgi:hypothetical protein